MTARFQTFSSSVRPLRVAVFTKADDPEWQSTCLAIIEFLSQLWGGASAIIVPTDGTSIDGVFWALLSAHDPDLILTYQRTGEDVRRNQRSQFEELVTKEVDKAILEGVGSEWARTEIPKSLAQTHWGDFTIDDGLVNEILTRLAPFSFERNITQQNITAGCAPFYPLTSIVDVLDQVEHPKEIVEIRNESTIPVLWLAAALGWSTAEHSAALNAKGVPATPVFTNQYDESDLIRWGIRPGEDFSGKTPFDISLLGLDTVWSKRSRRFELPTVLVLGDSIQDFCLYYSLRRLHGRAIWISGWFLENQNEVGNRLRSALSNALTLGRLDNAKSFTVTSASLPLPEIEKVRLSLAPIYSHISLSAEALSASSVAKLVLHPLRIYARGSIEKLSTHQLLDDELPGPFESLRPIIFKTVNPQEHRWIVEIGFRNHRIPRHPALGSFLANDPNLGEDSVRASNDGLAYICPGGFVRGIDPDFNLVRPSIRIPNALVIFRRALEYGAYDCAISDKGKYESETVDKLGGIELAGRALRNSKLRSLLEKFLDQSGPVEGVYDNGVFLKDQRRYLNFAATVKLLGSNVYATEIIDDYISKKLFYRGLILRCSNCSDVGWFSVDEITHNFTCRRCGKKQQYTKTNWRHPDEPSWFYKLDEITYQALLNNGVVPILTLDALREKCKDSFLFCPELRINVQGEKKNFMELDICCIPDGELCIGEAKSNGTLATKGISASETATKYRDLAVKLGATRVIFSTSSPAWDVASETAMESTFAAFPHIQVSRFAAPDL